MGWIFWKSVQCRGRIKGWECEQWEGNMEWKCKEGWITQITKENVKAVVKQMKATGLNGYAV